MTNKTKLTQLEILTIGKALETYASSLGADLNKRELKNRVAGLITKFNTANNVTVTLPQPTP